MKSVISFSWVNFSFVLNVYAFPHLSGRKEAEPLALSEIHARPISNVYLADTARETEQEEDPYGNHSKLYLKRRNRRASTIEESARCGLGLPFKDAQYTSLG